MERTYTLTDLGNGYFIPTMTDGKHLYHHLVAIYSMDDAQEFLDEHIKNCEHFEDEWHIVV